MAVWGLLFLLSGCGDSAPKATPQSVPVGQAAEPPAQEPLTVVVPKDPAAVRDVVPIEEFGLKYPALLALQGRTRDVALGVMHLVPGPCGPCMEAEEHLARCAMRPTTAKCINIPRLVAAAVGAAAAGKSFNAVKETVDYPDIWLPLPPVASGRVAVDLVVAPDDPWAEDVMRAKSRLEFRFGPKIEVRVSGPDGDIYKQLVVTTTPVWAVAGYRMRGAQSAPAIARIIDRHIAVQP